MNISSLWRPFASAEILRSRAHLYKQLRNFMSERNIMEVDTPILSNHATTDPYIDSFNISSSQGNTYYLHTSPEFCMKRLLAAGSGSIYQISHVFREGELGKKHTSEFVMLEWYRLGFNYYQLMDDVGDLILYLGLEYPQKKTYADAFLETININPHTAKISELVQVVNSNNWDTLSKDRHELLDYIFSTVVLDKLNTKTPLIIYDYPKCMASLAKLRVEHCIISERFELFIDGMELANGFNELTNGLEQRQRFISDLNTRKQYNKSTVPMDENLLSALDFGLPDCSGVALGIDRLLMVLTKKTNIKEINSFTLDNN